MGDVPESLLGVAECAGMKILSIRPRDEFCRTHAKSPIIGLVAIIYPYVEVRGLWEEPE